MDILPILTARIAQREKSLSGNQVNRKWISGEQENRGYSVKRIGMLGADSQMTTGLFMLQSLIPARRDRVAGCSLVRSELK